MACVVIASIASYLVFEPFPSENPVVNLLVGATVSLAFGLGAARHPWIFLAIGLVLWNCVPLVDHGDTARSLSVKGSFLGWIIGAGAHWYSRTRRPSIASVGDESECQSPDEIGTSKIVSAITSSLRRLGRGRGSVSEPAED